MTTTPRPLDVSRWHGVGGASKEWRLTPKGIETRSRDTPSIVALRRTRREHRALDGSPLDQLAARAVRMFSDELEVAASSFGVPIALLVAIACAETQAGLASERVEAHLGDRSIGIMQTLTSTAWQIGRAIGWPRAEDPGTDVVPAEWLCPRLPESLGGSVAAWRTFLGNPYRSICYGAATLWTLNERGHLWDPVLLAASYNAGGTYAASNPWGLRHAWPYLDSVIAFYNDAVAALGPESRAP